MEQFDVRTAWTQMSAPDAKLNSWEANFVKSVARDLKRYSIGVQSLTLGRIQSIRRWWDRANAPAEAAPQREHIPVPQLVGIFDTAKANLKYPKITFRNLPGIGTLKLSRAGDRSAHPGCVQVTDGGSYGNNRWYGRVVEGVFERSNHCTDEVLAMLQSFEGNPAKIAGEYGHASGACCFCDRALDDPRSTTVGYGPVCAKNYGLPWGKK